MIPNTNHSALNSSTTFELSSSKHFMNKKNLSIDTVNNESLCKRIKLDSGAPAHSLLNVDMRETLKNKRGNFPSNQDSKTENDALLTKENNTTKILDTSNCYLSNKKESESPLAINAGHLATELSPNINCKNNIIEKIVPASKIQRIPPAGESVNEPFDDFEEIPVLKKNIQKGPQTRKPLPKNYVSSVNQLAKFQRFGRSNP